MTAPRYSHGCAFLNGQIYVVGGYVNGSLSNVMEAFHVEQGERWESKASMNKRRINFGVSVII